MKRGWMAIGIVAAALAAGAVALYVGYRVGVRRTEKRIGSLAQEPEPGATRPAEWQPTNAPAAQETPSPAPATPAAEPPFAIDVTKPLRISWPLDIGPDDAPDHPDERVCLRARQGANELQTPGGGRACFPFRLAKAEKLRAWFRVRWTNDGTGSLSCNNSWFVGFDDRAAEAIEGDEEGWEEGANRWHWLPGPTVELSPGVHWLRVEVREDGVCMDRAALVGANQRVRDEDLDRLSPVACGGLAGVRPPFDPQRPIGEIECWALPTRSLAIGAGHVNEITVGASWQGAGATGFRGAIRVHCPTAPDLAVEGKAEIACGPDAPFAKNVLTLRFPDDAPRRAHVVGVSITDASGRAAFRDEARFVKGWAWAFLGPFRIRTAEGERRRGAATLDEIEQPCDRSPERLAALESTESLGLASLAARDQAPAWRIVSDGSCYDWTAAVDFATVFGPQRSAFAYAATFIEAQTLLRHRSFEFQVDDAGWLWMNGTRIATSPVDLPKEANRLWVSAQLNPGANAIVVKALQTGAYWGFRVDVIDWHWQGRRGDVITGVGPLNWPKR